MMTPKTTTKQDEDDVFNPSVKVIFKLGFRERERLKQLAAQQEMDLAELMVAAAQQLLDSANSKSS